MGWIWRYETADGKFVEPTAGTTETFPSQADAESWLGETFRTLLEQGADQVSLLHDGEVRYTMSLHPAD